MKISKRQLRRIVAEACGGIDYQPSDPMQAELPCPHGMAASIQQSGASPEEILAWIHDLLMDLTSEPEIPENNFYFPEEEDLLGDAPDDSLG